MHSKKNVSAHTQTGCAQTHARIPLHVQCKICYPPAQGHVDYILN